MEKNDFHLKKTKKQGKCYILQYTQKQIKLSIHKIFEIYICMLIGNRLEVNIS